MEKINQDTLQSEIYEVLGNYMFEKHINNQEVTKEQMLKALSDFVEKFYVDED